jgi:hypothetical protein
MPPSAVCINTMHPYYGGSVVCSCLLGMQWIKVQDGASCDVYAALYIQTGWLLEISDRRNLHLCSESL